MSTKSYYSPCPSLGFGAPATSQPAFGGFGTTATTQATTFGQPAAAKPAFGGFGAPAATAQPSFSFGPAAGTAQPAAGGLFGATAQVENIHTRN